MSYTIKETRHGILVFGQIPIPDFVALSREWAERGFTQLDLGAASALGAAFAVTSEAGSKAWRPWIERLKVAQ